MQLNEETCPVSESLLGELYRASLERRQMLIETIPSSTRALLAVYCRRRGHLAPIGLAIASACDRDDLIDAGGDFGAILYDQARAAPELPRPSKISLSQGAFMRLVAQDLI